MSARLSDATEKPGIDSETGAGKGLTPHAASVCLPMVQHLPQAEDKQGSRIAPHQSADHDDTDSKPQLRAGPVQGGAPIKDNPDEESESGAIDQRSATMVQVRTILWPVRDTSEDYYENYKKGEEPETSVPGHRLCEAAEKMLDVTVIWRNMPGPSDGQAERLPLRHVREYLLTRPEEGWQPRAGGTAFATSTGSSGRNAAIDPLVADLNSHALLTGMHEGAGAGKTYNKIYMMQQLIKATRRDHPFPTALANAALSQLCLKTACLDNLDLQSKEQTCMLQQNKGYKINLRFLEYIEKLSAETYKLEAESESRWLPIGEWLSEANGISPLVDLSSYCSLLHAHSNGVRLSPPQVDEMPANLVHLLNKNHQKLDKAYQDLQSTIGVLSIPEDQSVYLFHGKKEEAEVIKAIRNYVSEFPEGLANSKLVRVVVEWARGDRIYQEVFGPGVDASALKLVVATRPDRDDYASAVCLQLRWIDPPDCVTESMYYVISSNTSTSSFLYGLLNPGYGDLPLGILKRKMVDALRTILQKEDIAYVQAEPERIKMKQQGFQVHHFKPTLAEAAEYAGIVLGDSCFDRGNRHDCLTEACQQQLQPTFAAIGRKQLPPAEHQKEHLKADAKLVAAGTPTPPNCSQRTAMQLLAMGATAGTLLHLSDATPQPRSELSAEEARRGISAPEICRLFCQELQDQINAQSLLLPTASPMERDESAAGASGPEPRSSSSCLQSTDWRVMLTTLLPTLCFAPQQFKKEFSEDEESPVTTEASNKYMSYWSEDVPAGAISLPIRMVDMNDPSNQPEGYLEQMRLQDEARRQEVQRNEMKWRQHAAEQKFEMDARPESTSTQNRETTPPTEALPPSVPPSPPPEMNAEEETVETAPAATEETPEPEGDKPALLDKESEDEESETEEEEEEEEEEEGEEEEEEEEEEEVIIVPTSTESTPQPSRVPSPQPSPIPSPQPSPGRDQELAALLDQAATNLAHVANRLGVNLPAPVYIPPKIRNVTAWKLEHGQYCIEEEILEERVRRDILEYKRHGMREYWNYDHPRRSYLVVDSAHHHYLAMQCDVLMIQLRLQDIACALGHNVQVNFTKEGPLDVECRFSHVGAGLQYLRPPRSRQTACI